MPRDGETRALALVGWVVVDPLFITIETCNPIRHHDRKICIARVQRTEAKYHMHLHPEKMNLCRKTSQQSPHLHLHILPHTRAGGGSLQ